MEMAFLIATEQASYFLANSKPNIDLIFSSFDLHEAPSGTWMEIETARRLRMDPLSTMVTSIQQSQRNFSANTLQT